MGLISGRVKKRWEFAAKGRKVVQASSNYVKYEKTTSRFPSFVFLVSVKNHSMRTSFLGMELETAESWNSPNRQTIRCR